MQVQTIKAKDGKSLVEWSEGNNIFRAWFPTDMVKQGEVENIERGMDYGDDFGARFKMITKADIVQALHNQGLWTYADLTINPAKVQVALAAAVSEIVTTLVSPKEG